MDNRRAIIISMICFLISLLLIAGYVRVKRYEMTREFGEEVEVVIAAKAIPEYATIRADMVTTATVFKNFRQPQTVTDINDVIGKSAYVPFYENEQITLTKLVTQEGKPVLDRQVEKTTRAVTIPISPSTGVGRLIRPGNRVDILCAANYDTGDNQMIFEIKTVAQNVLVLATGKNIQNAVPTRVNREVLGYLEEQFEEHRRKDFAGTSTEMLPTSRPDDNYTSLTVQLKPEDAEKVIFLMNKFGDSRLYFTLRNSADQKVASFPTTLLDDVLGPDSDYGDSKRKPPPPMPRRPPRFYDSRGGVPTPVD